MLLNHEVLLVSGVWGLLASVLTAWILGRKDSRLLGRSPVFRRANVAPISVVAESLGRRRRNKQITAEWPTLLEGMVVAVAAGMDVLRAFEISASKARGPLREAAEKVLLGIHSGMSLPAALALMEKDGIEPARRLRATLAQAEVLGTPISEVLEALSAEYHTLEKQCFESRLNALPVKLSIITVIFLLPPVLIVSVMPHVFVFISTGW